MHVFLDHRASSSAGAGASTFLYPFWSQQTGNLHGVLEDVRRSVVMKAAEIGELRTRTLEDGREGDVALAISTSGNSRRMVEALFEARRRGLKTVALVGYDGGRVAADALADHVVVAPSQNIPRIQEAHASAYHVLRELVEAA